MRSAVGMTALGTSRFAPIRAAKSAPSTELDRLSNILKSFNEQFGNIPWVDADRIHRVIVDEIRDGVDAANREQVSSERSPDVTTNSFRLATMSA